MKLPNGFGSVTKLSGNRRKPYLARVTLGWTVDEVAGKSIQNRVPIGTFKTKKEALEALAEYGANPYDIRTENMTLAELYQKWTAAYFPTLKNDSSARTVTSAWSYCHEIHSMKAKDVRARHIKGIMEDGYIIPNKGKDKGKKVLASPGTKARIKSMFNLMLDYAVEYEVVDRNYARTFDISDDIIKDKEAAKRDHFPLRDHEMQKLWDNLDFPYVDLALVQCYGGWRPQELGLIELSNVDLENWSFTGGMKTEAGIDRIVPIHTRIRSLVKNRYEEAVSLGSEYLFNCTDASKGGIKLTYDKYAYRFEKILIALQLNPDHRPHDPRSTFITNAKKAGVDEYVIKRLVGHAISDVTEKVYTERNLEWLRTEIEKIP